jgi:DNA-binding SARP family transcriptional activator/tetratricopeptide (TPR) repeat protein
LERPALAAPVLTVRLLGGAAIERDGTPLGGRVARRHPLALLALLATAQGRAVSRDKLVAWLWPEGEPETVRHRLNTLLYDLRRVFGRDAIVSVGGDVRLDTALVWTDVAHFLDAVGRGDHAAAITLYRGPLLDGFHLPEAEEFDRWHAAEADRLARLYAAALEANARAAEDGQDHRLAAERWLAAARHEPLAAGPALGVLRSLAAAGETAEALRFAEQHARALETELGAAPDAAVLALVERIRSERPSQPLPSRATNPLPSSPHAAAIPAPPRTGSSGGDERRASSPENETRPKRRPRIAIAALLIVLLGAGALVMRGRESAPAMAADAEVTRVAVLPFVVRGSERVGYLGEGMASLLGMTLDGAGPLRTIDPHAVLAFVRRAGDDAADPATGRRVAAHFAARHFVIGTIVESGARIDVDAALYDAGGALLARASGTAADESDIIALVDALTRQFLSPRYATGVERLAGLAVNTTTSLPALKAFLTGESRLRAGEHAEAADAFRLATREDSTFALAWYRLAVAAEWSLQPADAAAAVARAVQNADRLPERDRLLMVGWQAYAAGEAERAEEVYRRVLDLYPDEIEAWLQLGEIAFHYAASRGRPIADARPAFERVLAFEPEHEAAHVHLARIAASQHDRARLARHVRHLVARNPDGTTALEMKVLDAFVRGDRAEAERLRAAFRELDSYAVLGTLLNLFYAGSLDGIEWAASLLVEPERPREVRTAGHIVIALSELARGRRLAALRAAERVRALEARRGAELRAILATMPFLPPDSTEAAYAYAALAAELVRPTKDSFFLPDTDDTRALLAPYLAGLLSARLGDVGAARRHAATLVRLVPVAQDPALAQDLALGIHAEIERDAGNRDAALAGLDGMIERPRYQLVLPSPFHARLRERFVRAELLVDAQRVDEARSL